MQVRLPRDNLLSLLPVCASFTRLRRKPRSPDRRGMRASSDLSGEALAKSEALAKEDWSFGGLRPTKGATGSCPWGSSNLKLKF